MSVPAQRKPYTPGAKPHYSNDRPRPSQSSASTSSSRPRTPAKPVISASEAKKERRADDALDLSNTILTAPPALAHLTNLHKLDLSNCGLTSLAFVKEAKATLTWLNVSGNPLNGEGAWDGVEQLGRLFVLNASNCGLTEVPSVIESLHSLKALVITHNSLTSLSHVKQLSNLNTIIASNNTLTSLPASLTTLPSLKKLAAAHNLLTSSSLPDLSLLALLREVKLNNNPRLVELPPHFSSWGKGSLGELEFKGKAKRTGLEIVDLGNCGFEDWMGLKELAGQSGIVNLGLKGTKVAEEAKEDGFDEFKSKLTIILPNLRILDGQRFDPKFFDLKAKRALRPADQRIVDAGPMARAKNALAEMPIIVPDLVVRKKRRAPLAEGEERGVKRVREEVVVEEKEVEVEEEEVVVKKKKGRKERKAEEEAAAQVLAEEKAARKERRAKRKAVEEEEADPSALRAAPVEKFDDGEKATKKRKKNRHGARVPDVVEPSPLPPPPPTTPSDPTFTTPDHSATISDPTAAPPATHIDLPLRKRGRKSKFLGDAPRAPKPPPVVAPSVPKKKKDPRGTLSALLGTLEEQAAARAPKTGANAVVEQPRAPVVEEGKKTSVLKVVEVQRKREKGEKVDVGSLFGLGGVAGGEGTAVGLGGWD